MKLATRSWPTRSSKTQRVIGGSRTRGAGTAGRAERRGDLLGDGVDVAGGVDDADALGLLGGDGEEAGAHALVEREVLGLEAVGAVARGALDAERGVDVEQRSCGRARRPPVAARLSAATSASGMPRA